MKSIVREELVSTRGKYELVDITGKVERTVRESGIKNGVCLVFAPHATAAIIANENERGLVEDIVEAIRKLIPENGRWKHNIIDDNASAHIASSLIGPSRIFPVVDGRLVRGTWQNIFLVELDGPRPSRRVIIEVIGD